MGKNQQKSYVCMYVCMYIPIVYCAPLLLCGCLHTLVCRVSSVNHCVHHQFSENKNERFQNADDSVCRLPPPYPCWTCTCTVPAVPRALDCVLLCVQLVCSVCGPLRPTVWIPPAFWPLSAPSLLVCLASLLCDRYAALSNNRACVVRSSEKK